MTLIHMPALLAGEFGISRSHARRALAQGAVKLNGETVTDLAVDLAAIPGGDPVAIELGGAYPRDAILEILDASSRSDS